MVALLTVWERVALVSQQTGMPQDFSDFSLPGWSKINVRCAFYRPETGCHKPRENMGRKEFVVFFTWPSITVSSIPFFGPSSSWRRSHVTSSISVQEERREPKPQGNADNVGLVHGECWEWATVQSSLEGWLGPVLTSLWKMRRGGSLRWALWLGNCKSYFWIILLFWAQVCDS